MANPDIFPNLPGFVAEVNDGGLKLIPPPSTLTQAVVLIGTSEDGPLLTPVRLTSLEFGDQVFGLPRTTMTKREKSKALTLHMNETYMAGCTDIWLMRATGTFAELTLASSTIGNPTPLLAQSVYPGERYNTIEVEVTATQLKITPFKKLVVGGVLTFVLDAANTQTFTLSDYVYWSDLTDAVDRKAFLAKARLIATNPGETIISAPLDIMASTVLSGGSNQLDVTDVDYRDALVQAYKNLEDFADVDYVVPLGAYVGPSANGDDLRNARNLALFCFRASGRNNELMGALSMDPLENPTLQRITDRADLLSTLDFNMDATDDYTTTATPTPSELLDPESGNTFHMGFYISLLEGRQSYRLRNFGETLSTSEAAYAGLLASMLLSSGSTRKPIRNSRGLHFHYGAHNANKIATARIVTFQSTSGNPSVVDGVTYGLWDPTGVGFTSDYHNASTLRITQVTVGMVRRVCEPFIGEVFNNIQKNAMATNIEGVLNSLKDAGVLEDFEFEIIQSINDKILGQCFIDLILVPALELKKIRARVSLRPVIVRQS